MPTTDTLPRHELVGLPVRVADAASDRLVVHTENYAPAVTDLPPDPEHLERFASERVERHTVTFHEFEIPVVVYRENVLGTDPFTTKEQSCISNQYTTLLRLGYRPPP